MARITGKLGAVYLGTTPTKVADIFDWEFSPTTEVFPCDIKGDAYSRFSPSHASAKFSAKRRLQTNSELASRVADAAVNATQLLFRLDLIDANTNFTQITGQGYVSAGSLNAPRDPVDDTFEITFDGTWTMTPSFTP